MSAREHLIHQAQAVYRSFGFVPIETPALEYSRILLGKGGAESDKQMYRFQDQGKRDVALRFDLTVPFARFAAQHIGKLGTPFKRYHIGTVWRAEKPQKGRFREFMQCDFDTIGTTSNLADIETLFVIHDLMVGVGFDRFTIRVNNRMVLNGLLESLSLAEKTVEVLRALDKFLKIGRENVIVELIEVAGASEQQAEQLLKLTTVSGSNEEMLEEAEEWLQGNETGTEGVQRLRQLLETSSQAGIPAERIQLDLAIARGLDYYTGTIYETFLDDLPGIGSVCSGGRYDNLAELYTKQSLPGVGASLGLDRLLAAMEELQKLEEQRQKTPVLITILDMNYLSDYLRLGRLLRQAGIPTEVYSEPRPLKKQLKFANDRGFQFVIIAGEEEFSQQLWQVKNFQSGEQQSLSESELITTILQSIL